MNRLLQTTYLLIATAALAGGAVLAATPPKGEEGISGGKDLGAGNPARAVGSTTRTIDPVRSGISETGWLDALRHVQVTELQVPLITRVVRTYLDQYRRWQETMGIELEMVVAEIRRIREAGGDIPPELSTRVRIVRGAMPKWAMTQRLIIAELTPGQVEALLLEIDRVKAELREKRRAENRRRAMRNSKTGKPAGGAEQPAMIEPAAGGDAAGAKAPAPKPWSFVQSEETPSMESTDRKNAPEKTDG